MPKKNCIDIGNDPPNDQPPSHFFCCVSNVFMKDPVILVEDGKTYEREFIQRWFERGKRTSPWYAKGKRMDPRTTRRLKSQRIIPNIVLKNEMDLWQKTLELNVLTYEKQKEFSAKIKKYKKAYPNGSPFIVACQNSRVKDVHFFIENQKYNLEQRGLTQKDIVNQFGYDSSGLFEYTGLMIAAVYEHVKVVEYLLKYQNSNIDISIANVFDGSNVLHLAANYNKKSLDIINMLVIFISNNTKNDKDKIDFINKLDNNGLTPMDRAKWNRNILRLDIIELLKKYGGKCGNEVFEATCVTIRSSKNKNAKHLYRAYKLRFPNSNPFIVACETGDLESVKFFIENCERSTSPCFDIINQLGIGTTCDTGDVDIVGQQILYTGLMKAAMDDEKCVQVVEYLLSHEGIDITIVNNAGYNCLHLAVQYNKCSTNIISMLLKHHQSSASKFVNKVNKYGSTPLDLTRYNNNKILRKEIEQMLKGKGGKKRGSHK
jgi:ankyrin repeat protein